MREKEPLRPPSAEDEVQAPAASSIAAAWRQYEIAGRCHDVGSAAFADAVAAAHASHVRLRCLCQPSGVEMYVARQPGQSGGYGVKRMPDSGWRHAPDCPSYSPAAALSGLGPLLGSAIAEDPVTGETALKLDFALVRMTGRAGPASGAADSGSVSSVGARLTLRGLLHYLWDEAELTRWQAGFAGRRTWATVRRHLLAASERKTTGREPLRLRMYVPEPFFVDERDAIDARRAADWSKAVGGLSGPRPLMLLIAEVKEIVPARYGFKLTVKHLPDPSFAIDEVMYRALARRYEAELSLWAANEDVHMIVIATFGVNSAGVAALEELCLMPVTRQWLPVDDGFGKQLCDRLVAAGRTFTRTLRYNAPTSASLPFAVALDCEPEPVVLQILALDVPASDGTSSSDGAPTWSWCPAREPMPALPLPAALQRARPDAPLDASSQTQADERHRASTKDIRNLNGDAP